jgi:hypothetical protein
MIAAVSSSLALAAEEFALKKKELVLPASSALAHSRHDDTRYVTAHL